MPYFPVSFPDGPSIRRPEGRPVSSGNGQREISMPAEIPAVVDLAVSEMWTGRQIAQRRQADCGSRDCESPPKPADYHASEDERWPV